LSETRSRASSEGFSCEPCWASRLAQPRISDGKVLCRGLNSLAVDQEEHILESYAIEPTSELKLAFRELIDSLN